MIKFTKWWNLIFPSTKKYQEQLDTTHENVKDIREKLVVNGSAHWFINQCREHKDEVCNDDTP